MFPKKTIATSSHPIFTISGSCEAWNGMNNLQLSKFHECTYACFAKLMTLQSHSSFAGFRASQSSEKNILSICYVLTIKNYIGNWLVNIPIPRQKIPNPQHRPDHKFRGRKVQKLAILRVYVDWGYDLSMYILPSKFFTKIPQYSALGGAVEVTNHYKHSYGFACLLGYGPSPGPPWLLLYPLVVKYSIEFSWENYL